MYLHKGSKNNENQEKNKKQENMVNENIIMFKNICLNGQAIYTKEDI